ncbi:MAG: asparagine synthase-related protein, partial [Anaerolineae bacterium]|nr:asparagine synthase-related protein [Anaerolineae bacterium]
DIDGNSKSIFRQAMHGLVPAPILERRDKVGFSTPEQRWLNNLRPWVEQVLNSEAAHNVFALNLGKVTEEWQRISTGKKPFNFRVWRWLNLIHWAKRHAIEF